MHSFETHARILNHARDGGLEITIANPLKPSRPLIIWTHGEELTVCFAHSHCRIADYHQNLTEAELVESMILGISGIISGHSTSYASLAGGTNLGGGFLEGSSGEDLKGSWWNKADRFEVISWDGTGDKTISKSPES